MIRYLTVGLLALCAVPTALAEDKVKLEGTYEIVSGENDGVAIPADRIKGSMVTFTKDKVAGTDKDKKEFFASTYTVDWSAKPHRITMVSTTPKAGEKAAGIVQIDGHTVKICYNLPGGDVPTEFKTKEKQQCFVLKRKSDK